jgi:glutamate dehydrogenase
MGVDVQREPVRVAGCGDMSGDVFGNGMLLSKAIKLVAAFDHRHIFIDPEPDPAASWKERKRMFGLPRSSWEDYDKKLISKGGGVFARTMKSIPLSKEARRALGVEAGELEPEALISAILAAPVDLLWFGGIGTYIKATSENNVQVGDPANDTLRIDAADVRAKVIGEGANLGITQAGRIEFALAGGRINTDFIDNSAGVNCSDEEVNIKIALAAATRAGKLSAPKRNALLEAMTDEVAQLVLENNRLQALALSIAEAGGAPAVAAQLHLIEALEQRGALDRQTEGLASGEDLARRAGDGLGLTRPELAVLLSSTKLVLQDAIERSSLPDDPALTGLLLDYFPSAMRAKFKREIEGHQLRRAIVATSLANLMINRLGIVHTFELSEEEGVGLADICASFVSAERLFEVGALWRDLETAKMPEDVRIYLFRHTAGALRNHMADLIRAGASTTMPSEMIAALDGRVQQLSSATGDLLTAASRLQSQGLIAEFVRMGAPERLAAKVAHLYDLDGSVGLASLSRTAEIDARELTAAFTDLGQRLGLDWAQSTAAMMNPSDVWERLLVAGLSRDFQQMRLDSLRRLSRRKGAKENPAAAVAAWSSEHAAAIGQFKGMIGRAQAQTAVAPAMLAQIASQARNLLAR